MSLPDMLLFANVSLPEERVSVNQISIFVTQVC